MKKMFNAMQNLIYGDTRLILTDKQLVNTKSHR